MRPLFVTLVGGLLVLSCVHATKTRSQGPQSAGKKGNKPVSAAQADGGAAPPANAAQADGGAAPQASAAQADGGAAPKNDEASGRSEAITTSKTTNDMFKEEGIKKLQRALATKQKAVAGLQESGKLDTKTQDALRAFQKEQQLPDTGLPDYESIRRLGVKPEEVYQHSPPAQRTGVQ
jgi:peptidoglycan hydrolase-like protein with peptidoglycan-binding domain